MPYSQLFLIFRIPIFTFRYILANDPDADRLGVAQKLDDKWKILSGNEIGGLFGWWHLKTFREKNPGVYMN